MLSMVLTTEFPDAGRTAGGDGDDARGSTGAGVVRRRAGERDGQVAGQRRRGGEHADRRLAPRRTRPNAGRRRPRRRRQGEPFSTGSIRDFH